MDTSYSPVQYVYREVIDEEIEKGRSGKIFYFCNESICTEEGRIVSQEEIPQQGIFITLDNGKQIRIDRIITLFGKPGAAFDEYDAFGNACMDCTGGVDL